MVEVDEEVVVGSKEIVEVVHFEPFAEDVKGGRGHLGSFLGRGNDIYHALLLNNSSTCTLGVGALEPSLHSFVFLLVPALNSR